MNYTLQLNDNRSIFCLLVQNFTLFVADIVPLALVARDVAKPLEALTTRLQRVGSGETAERMEIDGADDVRQSIDAFNAMITDEGPGVDPALAEIMFEPFTRAE